MWKRWIPWRWFVSRLARSGGFVDPIALMGRLQRFAQPSEVSEPIELLRAGVYFHARGLLNARAIQHNLDWVWPFWAERQFDPRDVAFVPRAFSITHVNLTHRNWTAVGQPDCDWLPVVDPRGLVTPLFDSWSIDAWVLPDDGEPLLPARAEHAEQRMLIDGNVAVETVVRRGGCELRSVADAVWEGNRPACRVGVTGLAPGGGWLAVALRPANPEGVALVHEIEARDGRSELRVEREATVHLDPAPERVCMSEYHRGDVLHRLTTSPERLRVTCNVGLASAAALYRLAPDRAGEVRVRVPLAEVRRPDSGVPGHNVTVPPQPVSWDRALDGLCELRVPDARMCFLFDAAVRTLVLHSPGEVYPGPFTYKRFWFRDAAFILDALLLAGALQRVRRAVELFPSRQDRRGYFRSQEGEWDSNGAAIWAVDRYRQFSGEQVSDRLARSVARGADWIVRKRLRDDLDAPHAGLMPAGFSAEHLGMNDFYFWDDFWSAAGLRSAGSLARERGDAANAGRWEREADRLMAAIDRAIERSEAFRETGAVPASPYRRMDAGAIGNLPAGYPLRLWDPGDPRLLKTIGFLMDRCWVHGGFFQDMIHSGVNAYLTLHVAQVLVRAGDPRAFDLVRAVAELASPTGQWPEAIHPHSLGGCMGDGQHVWAAAEWVLMLRNCFVREEGDRLVIGAGLPAEWLEGGEPLRLGPTPTPYGPVTVEVTSTEDGVRVSWSGEWRGKPPGVEVAVPGFGRQTVGGADGSVRLTAGGRGAMESMERSVP